MRTPDEPPGNQSTARCWQEASSRAKQNSTHPASRVEPGPALGTERGEPEGTTADVLVKNGHVDAPAQSRRLSAQPATPRRVSPTFCFPSKGDWSPVLVLSGNRAAELSFKLQKQPDDAPRKAANAPPSRLPGRPWGREGAGTGWRRTEPWAPEPLDPTS